MLLEFGELAVERLSAGTDAGILRVHARGVCIRPRERMFAGSPFFEKFQRFA